jgi:Icc-related predicted phosphoesterase
MKKNLFLAAIILTLLLATASCERLFEYSPYSSRVPDSRRNTHEKNLEQLRITEPGIAAKDTFKIGLISDSHTYYNSLAEIIRRINDEGDIDLVLHGGDMTDGGMIAEYSIFHQIMGDLRVPYFTVIGNHDCLANGRYIYNDMFGELNYSFIFNNCKFIFFNNIIWELNNAEPDYPWLADELLDSAQTDHVFVIAHIPPWSDQFTPLNTYAYSNMMDSARVDMSIHGHHHDHYFGNYFIDDVPYLVIGSPGKDTWCTLTVTSDTLILETKKL